jgi:hypothetical protein
MPMDDSMACGNKSCQLCSPSSFSIVLRIHSEWRSTNLWLPLDKCTSRSSHWSTLLIGSNG